jgi:LysR family glycine cleavage system transcriptional activator
MQKSQKRSTLPLNALRVFDMAARRLSFTKAAKELHVTQGAVSRQIKILENELQVPLFHRLHRQLKLTDQGQKLLVPLTEALDQISDTIDNLEKQDTSLNLKVLPTFAIRWLIPRLHKFQKLHPEVEVRFTTSNVNVDFKHENFDIGITYRSEKTPGVERVTILEEYLTPVFSPMLLSGDSPLIRLEDLKDQVLLHNNPDQHEWRKLAIQNSLDNLPFDQGMVFDIDDAALHAAAAGLGVALSEQFFIREDLAAKRLLAPFKEIKEKTGEYYLVWPEVNNKKANILKFKNWILNEIC